MRSEVIQQKILRRLTNQRAPATAYQLLDALRAEMPKLAPPTIYRALAALTKTQRVHRIESLNAYVACRCGRHHTPGVMTICGDCGAVEEALAPALVESVLSTSEQTGFLAQRPVIELHGLCAHCAAEERSA
jgi:Fur family zinc uptake transcriptional regulator